MRRFIINEKCSDGDIITLKVFCDNEDKLVATHKNMISYEEDFDTSYKDYMNQIKEKVIETLYDYRGRQIWKIPFSNGYILFRPYIGNDNEYIDGCDIQTHYNIMFLYPITWTCSNPKEFLDNYINRPECNYKVVSYRVYGEPKLTKPKELKGIKVSFSVPFIMNNKGQTKATFQCFVKDNDVYIKCTDYHSRMFQPPDINDIGLPLIPMYKKYFGEIKKGQKFVYDDNWGSVVLRNEAWLKFENLVVWCKLEEDWYIKKMLYEKFALSEHYDKYDINDWTFFFERFVKELYKYLNLNRQ